MGRMVTADGFLLAVISLLKKSSVDTLVLNSMLDGKFASVYDTYFAQNRSRVQPNFNFIINDVHGNSTRFREALNSLRFSETLAFENPSFRRIKIKLDQSEADYFSEHIPASDTLKSIVERVFADEIGSSNRPHT